MSYESAAVFSEFLKKLIGVELKFETPNEEFLGIVEIYGGRPLALAHLIIAIARSTSAQAVASHIRAAAKCCPICAPSNLEEQLVERRPGFRIKWATMTKLAQEFAQIIMSNIGDSDDSLLIRAARVKSLEGVKLALLDGVSVDTQESDTDFTALHLAAACGCLDIVCLLLKNHANVNKTDNYGYTALYYAMYFKHSSVEGALRGAGVKC